MTLTEAKIREVINSSPFSWKTEQLMAATKPAVRLRARRTELDNLAPGASRFGGHPDLPPSTAWPTSEENENRPLEFLAQINFAEASRVTRLPGLPEKGWLAVFYDIDLHAYGFTSWHGLFFECYEHTFRRTAPVDKKARGYRLMHDDPLGDGPPPRGQDFHACALDMTAVTCPPDEAAFRGAGIKGGGDP